MSELNAFSEIHLLNYGKCPVHTIHQYYQRNLDLNEKLSNLSILYDRNDNMYWFLDAYEIIADNIWKWYM